MPKPGCDIIFECSLSDIDTLIRGMHGIECVAQFLEFNKLGLSHPLFSSKSRKKSNV